MPGYREALIETAVALNAAQAAFDLRHEVERAGKWEIEVLYGVFNLQNHQVNMPVNPSEPMSPENVNLAFAPTNPREFNVLAVQMAEILKAFHDPRPATAPRIRDEPGRPILLADRKDGGPVDGEA